MKNIIIQPLPNKSNGLAIKLLPLSNGLVFRLGFVTFQRCIKILTIRRFSILGLHIIQLRPLRLIIRLVLLSISYTIQKTPRTSSKQFHKHFVDTLLLHNTKEFKISFKQFHKHLVGTLLY